MTLSKESLLAKAIEFDAGNPVELSGLIIEPDDEIDMYHHYKISLRGGIKMNAWAVTNGFGTLNKDGFWEHEPMPSNREDDYIKRTRFPTVEAAFKALDSWKEKRMIELKELGCQTHKERMKVIQRYERKS